MIYANRLSVYYKIVWFAYLLIAPFYIFQSGYPQPADMLLILGLLPALAFAFLNTRPIKIPIAFLIGCGFVLMTFSTNIIHFLFTPDRKFLLSSLYYVYNFAVFIFVVYIFSRDPVRINRTTYYALGASILIELLMVISEHGQEIRAMGTFNNPNQLGYWSLLSFVLLVIVKRDQKLNFFDIGLMMAVLATQLLSLSKAGILSMLFCICIVFFSRLISNMHRLLLVALAVMGGIYLIMSDTQILQRALDINTIEAAYTRISTIGTQGDDSLEGRGYDRIIENPHYLILGAGEGANWKYSIQNKELHSGLATLLFSYGVIGFLTFFTFVYFTMRGLPLRHVLMIIPIMLYGLTHQNIRFTYFWVVLGAAYAGRYFTQERYDSYALALADNRDIGKTPPREQPA